MPARPFFAASLGLVLAAALVAGCGKGPDRGFTSYEELQKDPALASGEPQSAVENRAAEDVSARDTAPAAAARDAQTDAAKGGAPADSPVASSSESPAAQAPVEPASAWPAVAELPIDLLLAAADGNAARNAGGTPAATDAQATEVAITAASPRRVELLVPNREFKTERGVLRVTYDDFDLLKILNMDPVTPDAPELMPAWLKELDGKKVRVRGFMYPTFEETGITQFVLARDNQICCFGRDPKIYDLVGVTMHKGATTDYIQNRPFDVVGVFHIRPQSDGKRLSRLYQIDDATVIER